MKLTDPVYACHSLTNFEKTQILSNYGLPERENDPSPSKIRNNDEHKLTLKKNNVKLTDLA